MIPSKNCPQPDALSSHSFFYMYNRAAVKELRENYFKDQLQFLNKYYNLIGFQARQLKSVGTRMLESLARNGITVINTDDDRICVMPNKKALPQVDYSHNERITRMY
jgi:hypothetical protein